MGTLESWIVLGLVFAAVVGYAKLIDAVVGVLSRDEEEDRW